MLKLLGNYFYVLAEHPNGDSCVMRFPLREYGQKEINFQVLFTWEIDKGVKSDA